MAINPYLNFTGNCREAVEFYADVFGAAQPRFMLWGEMPPDPSYTVPEEARNLVMHTSLEISGTTVMFSDVYPANGFVAGNNISLTVVTTDKDEIVNWFNKLKEGGTIQMDLQETFWSKCYGNLRDKFGVEWQFSLDSGEMMA